MTERSAFSLLSAGKLAKGKVNHYDASGKPSYTDKKFIMMSSGNHYDAFLKAL
jgi:hypothetical protein